MADPRLARRAAAAQQSQQPPPPPPPPIEPAPSTTVITSTNGNAPAVQPAGTAESADGWSLKFATVCASNNNRSMEAHLQLSTTGCYPCLSFGTGSLVRLPGPSITQPNVYTFNNTSYDAMFNELLAKDPRLYRANGILPMLDRNRNVKWGPERWQDWRVGVPRLSEVQLHNKGATGTEAGVVDVVFTCEEKCWDAVVDDLLSRGSPLNRPVHVFNVDIKDNHEEALVGGRAILDLAGKLEQAARTEREKVGGEGWEVGRGRAREGFDEMVPQILAEWQGRWPHLPALWTLAWF